VFFAVTEHNLFIINVLRDFLAGRSFWLRLSEAKPRQVNPCQKKQNRPLWVMLFLCCPPKWLAACGEKLD
jgi:hypothetical protein